MMTFDQWWDWLIALVLVLSPFCLGFLNAFENSSQSTTTSTQLYENSFNESTSNISNQDTSTTVTLGGEGSGGVGGTSGIVVVAVAAVLILGGLFLLTRKK